MVTVLEIFHFLKIFPKGIKIISTCCSPFCVTRPMVEFLLAILSLENLLPRSLAKVVFFVIESYWLALISSSLGKKSVPSSDMS
jgi:hypothetical protein